jgi:glyoxylase-like metal-dependent hydrolase (beta-lactamase superfamily II)
MSAFICTTCGVSHATDTPPARCAICDEERQYVNPNGQSWTTLAELEQTHHNDIRELEPNLIGIGTVPQVAIGQRALFVSAPGGGVLWDCTALPSPEAIEAIRSRGGAKAIAISHPHFYSTMADWSERLGNIPIYLHQADRDWIMRHGPNMALWDGETQEIAEGITLVRCGGHFEGSAALHWAGGADGRGALFTSDTVMVVPDTRWMTFMRSYPNMIPVNAATVRRIIASLAPFEFDRVYGGWWDRVCDADAKAAVRRSAERYIAAIS